MAGGCGLGAGAGDVAILVLVLCVFCLCSVLYWVWWAVSPPNSHASNAKPALESTAA